MIQIETQILHLFTNSLIIDFFYILAPKNLKIGDIIKSGTNAEIKIGHSLPFSIYL
jgi:ribosomal protein L2